MVGGEAGADADAPRVLDHGDGTYALTNSYPRPNPTPNRYPNPSPNPNPNPNQAPMRSRSSAGAQASSRWKCACAAAAVFTRHSHASSSVQMVGVMHSVAIDGNEIQIDTWSSFFVSHFTNRIWHTVSAVLLRPAQRQHGAQTG